MNVTGSDEMKLQGGYGVVTVNLADNATWTGTYSTGPSLLTVTGGEHAVFINNGASGDFDTAVVLDVPVLGTGTILQDRASIEFGRSVSAGQSVTVGGPYGAGLTIDHPHEFLGSVSLGELGAIDLVGLARADSYSYANDMLRLWSGNRIIDTLRMTLDARYGLAVLKYSSGVNVVGLDYIGQSLPQGTALPTHGSS